MQAIPSSKFTYTNGVLAGFASELSTTGRLNDSDPRDVGVAVKSTRTGRVVSFVLVHKERREGELLWWELQSVDADADVKMRIFND